MMWLGMRICAYQQQQQKMKQEKAAIPKENAQLKDMEVIVCM